MQSAELEESGTFFFRLVLILEIPFFRKPQPFALNSAFCTLHSAFKSANFAQKWLILHKPARMRFLCYTVTVRNRTRRPMQRNSAFYIHRREIEQ